PKRARRRSEPPQRARRRPRPVRAGSTPTTSRSGATQFLVWSSRPRSRPLPREPPDANEEPSLAAGQCTGGRLHQLGQHGVGRKLFAKAVLDERELVGADALV